MLDGISPEEDDAFARRFVAVIRAGDLAAARQMIGAAPEDAEITKGLERTRQFLDRGEPLTFERVGITTVVYASEPAGTRHTRATYQLHFKDSWVLGVFEIERKPEGSRLVKWEVRPLADSLEALNRFTLRGKSFGQYLFLAACVAVPLVVLWALIVCLFTPVRRKWLWLPFILLGFVRFDMDWTDGEFHVSPISVLLFGVSFGQDDIHGPWNLSWAIPFAAIRFLSRRRALAAEAIEAKGEALKGNEDDIPSAKPETENPSKSPN